MEHVTNGYPNVDNMVIKTKTDEKYTFEKFTSAYQVYKNPAK